MRVQFVLTPTESKKLLSQAVMATESFKRALKTGTIIIHPSSTTVFMLSELGYELEPSQLWICGLTVPRGLCASEEILEESYKRKGTPFDPKKYSHEWILKKGKLVKHLQLKDALSQMGKSDLYIKSANAIDPAGKVGILFSAQAAGTIGIVKKAQQRQGFEIVLPTGLEKLIPGLINEVSKESPKSAMNFCTGTPCGVVSVKGTVITEVEAVNILSGAEATVVGAGGVGGAEGAVVLVAKGEREQITRAAEVLGSVKGATLPKLNLLECSECPRTKCHLSPVFNPSNIPEGGWLVPAAYKMKVRKQQ
jgi:hypothetical protein